MVQGVDLEHAWIFCRRRGELASILAMGIVLRLGLKVFRHVGAFDPF